MLANVRLQAPTKKRETSAARRKAVNKHNTTEPFVGIIFIMRGEFVAPLSGCPHRAGWKCPPPFHPGSVSGACGRPSLGWLFMRARERHRAGVLGDIPAGSGGVASGAALFGLTVRHMRRLIERYRTRGAAGLTHGHRARPSNRRRPAAHRAEALRLVRAHYQGYGPTLASEMLLERHGLRVPRETLRSWMREDGLWLTRGQRRVFHRSRPRRAPLGAPGQIDGAAHRWFGPDHPACTLLVFIDDATSRLMQLRFVPSESTRSYFEALEGYLTTHGCPVAFYSDKHTVFRVSKADAVAGQGMTQFGRALAELNIEILCANSSRLRAASSVRTAPYRTAWSRSCTWRASPRSRRRTRSCPRSWSSITCASRCRLPAPTTCTGHSRSRCPASATSCAGGRCATSASSCSCLGSASC